MIIKIFPKYLKIPIQKWLISKKFRKLFIQWLETQKRMEDNEGQSLLRKTFVLNGLKDIKWAIDLQREVRPFQPSDKFLIEGGASGLSSSHISEAVASLEKDGIWMSPIRLSDNWVSSVKSQLENIKATSRNDPSDVQFPRDIKPAGITYWHSKEDLEEIEEFQKLIMDPVIIEIVGLYLKCKPVYDMVASWWSYPSNAPDSNSAQLFHFDMDRIRWLKVFVYLNDVSIENGPHVFIKGSHLDSEIQRIDRDGRFSDEEARRIFTEQEVAILTAPQGTLFIEDTLGFHKGLEVKEGYRCIFEIEYSMGHFGYPHPESKFDAQFK